MSKRLPDATPKDPRAGIALILVLGFLSILIIMAVGFAISMRVERLVARTSLDHIKSRQLGEAALARVVWDINRNVGDQMVPEWSSDWIGGVFESIGTGQKATNLFSGEHLLFGYISNYVPRSYISAAVAAANNAEWIPFEYVDNGVTKRAGQYAYVVLDLTGLLDVNFDYSLTANVVRTRNLGASIYEVQLTNALLSELSGLRATNMIWGRLGINGQSVEKPWVRLETVAEIEPMLSRGFGGQAPLQTATSSVNLVTYSRIPRGFYASPGVVEAPTVIQNPLNQSELTTAFSLMGLPDAPGFYNVLRDYTDADNVPVNLDSYTTEAVPLINEVVVSNSYLDVGGGTSTLYRNEYRLLTEVWYPFSGTNNNTYSARLLAQYTGAQPGPNPGTINQTVVMNAPGGSWTMGDFLVITSTPQSIVTNILQDLADVKVRASVRVLENGVEVDRVGGSGATLVEINIGPRMTGPGVATSLGKQANDPRINWNGSDGAQWIVQNSHTLGRTNSTITATSAGADGHTAMYVANQPLRTVGELGLMLFDPNKHWQTISLLDGPNFYPVLDRFSLTTNQVSYGLVNPNGRNTNVIATVFNRMPVERVPFDPATTNLTIAQLRSLAARFADKHITLTNLSDLRFIGPQVTAALPSLPNTVYESMVRNSAGLFSPRQQLFGVFLVAQVQDDTVNQNVLAEQRGTGLIWRDPYIVSNNTHAVMVRNFRWLTE